MTPAMVEEPPWLIISEAAAELPIVMVTPLTVLTPPPEPAVNVRLFPLFQLRLLAMVILPAAVPAVPELVVSTVTLLLAKFVCNVSILMMEVLAPLAGVYVPLL